jgi:4,5-DOPA dioxygenase extradiol
MTTFPSLYLSHGSPMMALELGAAGAFLQRLGPAITATFGRPRAVLALSAHTLVREPVLLAAARHEAVYDFQGFPDALYRLRYDAPGAPALAERVQQVLAAADVPVHRVDQGGLDHGIWTPLRYMFPEGDVPVLPLGFVPNWTPARLHAMGQALAPLAREGVLVIGTGSITHNLRMVFGAGGMPAIDTPEVPTSAAFRGWVASRAAAGDWAALNDYRRQAPHAALMHPTDEHWLPWYPAGGAAGSAAVGTRLHDSVTYGCLGMDAYAFGDGGPALQAALKAAAAAPA